MQSSYTLATNECRTCELEKKERGEKNACRVASRRVASCQTNETIPRDERENLGLRAQRAAIMQDAKTYEKRTVNAFQLQTAIDMSEKRLSMGINVSILVILTIFGVLLSLPLRLLLNTNYHESRNKTLDENNTILAAESITIKTLIIPVDHRKLKRCPKFEYESRLKSVFQSDYDGNCTYTRACTTNDSKQKNDREDRNESVNREDNETSNALKEIVSENLTKKVEESGKDRRTKSVLVAGHILVTMLLISAIAALVEVLRIRFAKDKVLQRKPH